jgi:single-stranded DNA-binding protein
MHTVSGKLRKAPYIKDGCGQDGQSKMYIIELAEVIKDYQTQEKTYTNYKAMFFGKTDGAKQFYDKAFAEGSFVVVASEKLKVDQFQADNGTNYITLMMENARLTGAMPVSDMGESWGQPQQPQQQAPQQRAPQQRQPQQRAAQPQYNEPPMDFDDDIPF